MYEYCIFGLKRDNQDITGPLCLSLELDFKIICLNDLARLEQDISKELGLKSFAVGSYQLIRKIPVWERWLRRRGLKDSKKQVYKPSEQE